MQGKVLQNIREYMNARGSRNYSYYEVANIKGAMRDEHYDRKANGPKIDGKTRAGRALINQRVAQIANERMMRKDIAPADVLLYKQCLRDEYQDRTGKCAFGFPDTRKRLGYDEVTGLEVEA
jgi:hypothetical protein